MKIVETTQANECQTAQEVLCGANVGKLVTDTSNGGNYLVAVSVGGFYTLLCLATSRCVLALPYTGSKELTGDQRWFKRTFMVCPAGTQITLEQQHEEN